MENLPEGITEEQIAKAKACKSAEEVLALVKTEGIELSDAQLEELSGGDFLSWVGPDSPCKG